MDNFNLMDNFKLNQLPGCVKVFVICYLVLVLMILAFPTYMHSQEEAKKSPEVKAGMGIAKVAYAHGDEVHETEAPQVEGGEETERGDKKKDRAHHLLKAAHVHLGGHTLLFFTVGLLFALTTLRCPIKGAVFVLSALAVIAYTVALFKLQLLGITVLKASNLAYTLTILFMTLAVVKEIFMKREFNRKRYER